MAKVITGVKFPGYHAGGTQDIKAINHASIDSTST
jgi:hypothetical protein